MYPLTVFLVEGSEIIRLRLTEALTLLQGTILTGWSDEEKNAIASIEKHKPCVVVCSLQLYGGNGINVLKAIRKTKLDTTFIMLTDFPYAQYRESCKNHGADYFFDKSTEFMKVPEVIKRIQLQDAGKDISPPQTIQGYPT